MICLCLFVWIVYLKYLLAKKSVEARTEIEKYRLQLDSSRSQNTMAQLGYTNTDSENAKLIEYEQDH